MNMEIKRIEILSVGVDVGSSTSHLAFSKLVLIKDEHPATRRFNIEERNILYEGRIINTPIRMISKPVRQSRNSIAMAIPIVQRACILSILA